MRDLIYGLSNIIGFAFDKIPARCANDQTKNLTNRFKNTNCLRELWCFASNLCSVD